MKQKNSTKRTLALSLLVMLLCVAMLVGTTFAWFTDSASTAVNKIQAGTLDVQLLDAAGNSLEGQTLSWQKAQGHENDPVLWEPNCTYNTQQFYIKNNGNLNLKFKFSVSGITGDAKLLEVLDFTAMADASWFKFNTGAVSIATSGEFDLLKGYDLDTIFYDTMHFDEYVLEPGEKVGPIVISGHMAESAGNDYQGLSIDGIAITLVATQATGEEDSYDGTYDENATYPVTSNADLADAIQTAQPGSVVTLASGNYTLPAIPEGVTIAGDGADKTTVVTSADGYNVSNENVAIKDVTVDGTAASGVSYSGAINLKGNNATIENCVINGGGTGTWGASVYVNLKAGETAYIKNTKISGGFRGIFLGSQSGIVVVDNCDIDAVYPISVDGGGEFTVTVTNSKLHGWTSYSQITKATFTDTEFSMGASGYDVVAAYTDTTFTNCTFDSNFEVYAQVAGFNFVFDNCTKDGTPVTADNFKTLFPGDSDVWTKCTCTVNGVQVTA